MAQEETNLYEAIHAIREGVFYEDYDYAAGPGLRILTETMEEMVEFCERCERGEIRSKKTYAKFCKILARTPNPLLRWGSIFRQRCAPTPAYRNQRS